MNKIFLGIDGGGTKTAFSIIDENGKLLSETIKGTIHIKQVNKDEFEQIISEGINDLLQNSQLKLEDISFVFAGVPAYGEYPELINQVHDSFKTILGHDRFSCGNDCVAGWAAGQELKPGVNMVLGTGAIAYGIDYEGNQDRSSGWGDFCGDEGSAFWIAKKVIEIFAKESDGRYERGPLYDIVKSKLKLNSDFELISIAIDEMNRERNKVATLSPIILEAYLQGDKYADKIIDEVAHEAKISIDAVIRKLNFKEDENIFVSFTGGVFNMGDILVDRIKNLLSEDKRIKIVSTTIQPHIGSALMAYKESEGNVPEEVINRLRG